MRLIPEPLDLLYQAGARQQDRYDKDLDSNYKLQTLLAGIKNATFDREHKRQIDEEYYPIVSGIAEKMSASDKSYKPDLIKAATKFYGDQRIKTLEYNYEQEQTYLKDRGVLEKTQDFDNIYDERSRFINSRGKELTPFDYSGMKGKEDYIENFQSLMSGINSDSQGWEGYARDKRGELIINSLGQIQKSNGKYETITPEKNRQVAESNALAALSGKGGSYFVDKLFKQPVNYDNLSDDIKKKVLKHTADELELLGQKYIYSKRTQGEDLQNLREGTFDNMENELPGFLGTSLMPQSDIAKYKVYKPMANNYTLLKATLPEFEEAYGETPKGTTTSPENIEPKLTAEQQKVYDKYSTKYGRTGKAEVINSAVKDWNDRLANISINYPQNVKSLQNKDKLLFDQQQYTNREFIPIEDGADMFDNQKIVVGKDLASKIKEKGLTAKTAMMLGPDNPYKMGKATVVTFVDEGGNTTTAVVKPLPGEYSQADIFKNQMYDAKWNIMGESELTLIDDETGNIVKCKVIYDEVTHPTELDNSGRPIKTGEQIRVVNTKTGEDVIPLVKDIPKIGLPDAIQKAYEKLKKQR